MASIHIDDTFLEIRMSRLEKLGALRRQVKVPLDSIVSVTPVDRARSAIKGVRAPGTGVPGGLMLGTWRGRGGRSFVAVRGRGPGYVIELQDQKDTRLIVESEVVPALELWR
ncbi:MAG: hypothetical protein R2706_08610 [Acidimicrobiales bacterium]